MSTKNERISALEIWNGNQDRRTSDLEARGAERVRDIDQIDDVTQGLDARLANLEDAADEPPARGTAILADGTKQVIWWGDVVLPKERPAWATRITGLEEHIARIDARLEETFKRAMDRGQVEAFVEERFEVMADQLAEELVRLERPKPIVRPGIQRGKPERQKAGERASFWEGVYMGAVILGITIVILYECGAIR